MEDDHMYRPEYQVTEGPFKRKSSSAELQWFNLEPTPANYSSTTYVCNTLVNTKPQFQQKYRDSPFSKPKHL